MKKTCILALLFCILSSSVLAYEVLYNADVSCRTRSDVGTPPGSGNNHDNAKLTVRNEGRGEKSWIKFDRLGEYELITLRAAQLRLTLHGPEDGDHFFNVSAVNDDCLDNINWVERYSTEEAEAITWNNAPGNDISSFSDLDAAKTTHLIQVDIPDADDKGAQYFIDVYDILMADTDGIVQFALHYSSTDLNLCTHDHVDGPEYWPTLILIYPPLGADWPVPADKATVETDLAGLSWTNPEPNLPGQPIWCEVYFGTDPNRPQMDKVTLGNDIETVALTAGNFPRFVPLTDQTTYYWFVDCHDTVKGLIEGELWTIHVSNNTAPVVGAGDDVVTWLTNDPNTVTLSGSILEDDGLPDPPGEVTLLWERTAGPDSAVIDTPTALSTLVTFTEAGDYTFRLTADDSDLQGSDTVRVVVGADACDASHIDTGDPYDAGDLNEDCIVDMLDLGEFVLDWLNCSNTLEDCN